MEQKNNEEPWQTVRSNKQVPNAGQGRSNRPGHSSNPTSRQTQGSTSQAPAPTNTRDTQQSAQRQGQASRNYSGALDRAQQSQNLALRHDSRSSNQGSSPGTRRDTQTLALREDQAKSVSSSTSNRLSQPANSALPQNPSSTNPGSGLGNLSNVRSSAQSQDLADRTYPGTGNHARQTYNSAPGLTPSSSNQRSKSGPQREMQPRVQTSTAGGAPYRPGTNLLPPSPGDNQVHAQDGPPSSTSGRIDGSDGVYLGVPPQGDRYEPASNRLIQEQAATSQVQKSTSHEKTLTRIYQGQNSIPGPSTTVSKAEDDFIKTGVISESPDAEAASVRPGYGFQGAKTRLWTNYLDLEILHEGQTLYYYTMSVDPDDKQITPKGQKRKQIIKLMSEEDSFKILEPPLFATDFNTMLVTQTPLKIRSGEEARVSVTYRVEGAKQASVDAVQFVIRIKLAHALGTTDLRNYLNPNRMTSVYNDSPIMQAFNVLLGHQAKASTALVTVGNRRIFPLQEVVNNYEHQDQPVQTSRQSQRKPQNKRAQQSQLNQQNQRKEQVQQEKEDKKKLGQGLIALRGFFFNVIGASSRPLINVNISHAVFYQAIPLAQLLKSRFNFPTNEYPNRQPDYAQMHTFVKMLRVTTIHLPPDHNVHGKVRSICGLALCEDGTKLDGSKVDHPPRMEYDYERPTHVEFWEDLPRPSSSHTGSKGKAKSQYITVADFFTREACVVQPGQVWRKELSDDQSKEMIDFARSDPMVAAEAIAKGGRETLGFVQSSGILNHFGVKVGTDLITVPGRVLKKPLVEYGQAKTQAKHDGGARNEPNCRVAPDGVPSTLDASHGKWNYVGKSFYLPEELDQWYCVRIGRGKPQTTVTEKDHSLSEVLDNFRKVITASGVVLGPVSVKELVVKRGDIPSEELNTYLKDISTRQQVANNIPGESPTSKRLLVLVILPRKDNELYHTIKALGELKYGVQTICVVGSEAKFFRWPPRYNIAPNEQYFANIALKLNLKLGGINHILNESQGIQSGQEVPTARKPLGLIHEGSTMVMGIDVTHPSPRSHVDAPRIFCVVANTDKTLAQWPVGMGVQRKSKEEVISQRDRLIEIFKDRLRLWNKQNGQKYPNNIIIYRDGVSDGQYEQLLRSELGALREACRAVYNARDTKAGFPRLTLIVVAKRHHTRFYPSPGYPADKTNNALCGTVVDRGITQARTFDFYLQSHTTLQGTARPAHYIVLKDEVFHDCQNRADEIQKITHNMCYLFGRATTAVSICPPAYLADLACTRARSYLADQFAPSPPLTDQEKKQKEVQEKERTKRLKQETKEETGAREAQEKKDEEARQKEVLKTQQDRIEIHENVKDTMFYI